MIEDVQRKQTTGILLRNWLRYLLRQIISHAERDAYHARVSNHAKTKQKFNETMGSEILIKAIQYKKDNKIDTFDKIITHEGILCKKEENGEYQIRLVFS